MAGSSLKGVSGMISFRSMSAARFICNGLAGSSLSAEAAACKSIRIEENGVCTLKFDKKIRLLSIPKLPLSRSTANPLRSLKEREAIRPRISLLRL